MSKQSEEEIEDLAADTLHMLAAVPRDQGEAAESGENGPGAESQNDSSGKNPKSVNSLIEGQEPIEFGQSILSMKQQVREAAENPGGPMASLEKVQDQLIDNLECLNKRIENYIELLAVQRKSA